MKELNSPGFFKGPVYKNLLTRFDLLNPNYLADFSLEGPLKYHFSFPEKHLDPEKPKCSSSDFFGGIESIRKRQIAHIVKSCRTLTGIAKLPNLQKLKFYLPLNFCRLSRKSFPKLFDFCRSNNQLTVAGFEMINCVSPGPVGFGIKPKKYCALFIKSIIEFCSTFYSIDPGSLKPSINGHETADCKIIITV